MAVSVCRVSELSAGRTAQALTNQDVIEMVGLGLSDNLITDKIRVTQLTDFDTTVVGLRALKAARVSDAVIRVMVNAHPPSAASKDFNAPVAANEGAVPDEIGVYCVRNGRPEQMDPEIVGWKTGGVVKQLATLGLDKGHVNGKVIKSTSPVRLSNPLEFVVRTPEGTSVTEYQLLRLYEKRNRREFRVMTGGILHVSGGAERTAMTFSAEKIAARTWRIRLDTLPKGEYGILPPGVMSSSIGSSGKMYTFSVGEQEYSRGPVVSQSRSGADAPPPTDSRPGVQHSESSIGAWSDQNPTVRHDGVVLSRVAAGGPADQAGIKPGDVILAVHGRFLYTSADLNQEIGNTAPGTKIAVRYMRRFTIHDAFLVVGEAEPTPQAGVLGQN